MREIRRYIVFQWKWPVNDLNLRREKCKTASSAPIHASSFLLSQESTLSNILDSRFRGRDEVRRIELCTSLFVYELLVDDDELPHHAQVLVVEYVAVKHIRSVFSGISIESGDDNDLAFGIHQHGVLPT